VFFNLTVNNILWYSHFIPFPFIISLRCRTVFWPFLPCDINVWSKKPSNRKFFCLAATCHVMYLSLTTANISCLQVDLWAYTCRRSTVALPEAFDFYWIHEAVDPVSTLSHTQFAHFPYFCKMEHTQVLIWNIRIFLAPYIHIWSTYLFHTFFLLILEYLVHISMFFVLKYIISNVFFTRRFKSYGMLHPVGFKFFDVSEDCWRHGSNPRWPKWHWDRSHAKYFDFPLSVSYVFFHDWRSILSITDSVDKQQPKDRSTFMFSAESTYIFDTLIFLRSLLWCPFITV
jgi:hypothetical protein